MFEKLKTPAFLRSAREGLAEGKPIPVFKTLLTFLLAYIVAGLLQGFLMTPAMLVLLFTNEEYLAQFSETLTTGDQTPLYELTERMMASDGVIVAKLFGAVAAAGVAVFCCRVMDRRSLFSMGIRKKRAFSSALFGAGVALLLLFGAVAFAD